MTLPIREGRSPSLGEEIIDQCEPTGRDWDLVRALHSSYDVDVAPVTLDDAEWAAARACHW